MATIKVKTGQAYLKWLKKVAARVEKWPEWKKGEKSER